MKKHVVAITMRVDVIVERQERRDALDQRLTNFIAALGGVPLLIPNDERAAKALTMTAQPSAVVLSGGNDLQAVGGDAPERDATERRLLAWAAATNTPVLGICRGMQLLAVEAGATLRPAAGHSCISHELEGPLAGSVPSHHYWSIGRPPKGFASLSTAAFDGTCEAMISNDGLRLGMMWHPERLEPARREDRALIKSVLKL